MNSAIDYFGIVGQYDPETKAVRFLEERVVFLDSESPDDIIFKAERSGRQTIVFWSVTNKQAKKKVLDFFRE